LQDYLIDNLATKLWVPGWPDTIWLTDQVRVDRDFAVFGEVSYDVTPKLTLTGGLRVFEANNSLDGFFGFNDTFSSHTGVSQCFKPYVMFQGAPCTNLDKSVVETGYTHKLTAKYQIDDDRMVYATWSTGFRPGGINRRGTVPPYKPDKLINYELGWKTTWLDGTLRFNGALFWEDWEQFQFSFLGVNSFTEIHNASSATIKGIEADIDYAVTDRLTVTASGTYLDAHLDHAFCGPTGVTVCPSSADPFFPEAPAGTQLPGTPKFKMNMSGRYEFPIGDFRAHLQSTLVYQSRVWSDLRSFAFDPLFPPPSNPPPPPINPPDPIRGLLGQQSAFATVDLSPGIERNDWALEFFIKNVFDKRADLYHYAECTTQVCGHEPYIVTNTPRMFGLRYSQKFN
jgi:outer membrane receptor protein involved in Fe transport